MSLVGTKALGYRGIWAYQGSTVTDEPHRYIHYSGGLGTGYAKMIPMACYAEQVNKTFFCYGGTRDDVCQILIMVSLYDHETGTVPRPTIVMDKETNDTHDNPVIMLDDDGYVWIFANAHGLTRNACTYRSTSPYSVESFELVEVTNYSYAQPWFVPGRGFIFLHTRYIDGNRVLHWMTSQNGRTWSEPQILSWIGVGHYQVSWPCGDRVGTAFNYHQQDGGCLARTDLYYLETPDMGRTWLTAAGKEVETPLKNAKCSALVRNYKADGKHIFMKDINYDADGRPIILYTVSDGDEAGPQHGMRTWTTVPRCNAVGQQL